MNANAFFILIIISLLSLSGNTQTWQKNYAGTDYLNNVQFVNQTTVYAVSGSHLKRSEDAGKTWKTIEVSTENIGKLQDVFFVNEQVGYAVGGGFKAIILKTQDGGTTWKRQLEHSIGPDNDSKFSAVHFITENLGIAVGGDGLMARTENGGANWHLVDMEEGVSSFYDVCFKDETTAFASSINGFIKSTDAGKTWQTIELPTSKSINSIEFVNQQIGFTVGKFGTILRTTDGGETWQKLAAKFSQYDEFSKELMDVYCVDETHIYCVGEYGYVLYSEDGGEHWQINELRGTLWNIDGHDGKHMVIGGENGELYYSE